MEAFFKKKNVLYYIYNIIGVAILSLLSYSKYNFELLISKYFYSSLFTFKFLITILLNSVLVLIIIIISRKMKKRKRSKKNNE